MGISSITNTSTMFKCPFCEKAKMFKQSGHLKKNHMDLLYVCGPSNLDNIISSNALPQPMIQHSRDGYIGFLTIINISSQQLWTHQIQTKDQHLDYIDHFLKQHGIQ